MSDKNFGVKQINVIGGSGTPTITSPNTINLNTPTVAISTDLSVGGNVSVSGSTTTLSLSVGTGSSVIHTNEYGVGIGTTADIPPSPSINGEDNKLLVYGRIRSFGPYVAGEGVINGISVGSDREIIKGLFIYDDGTTPGGIETKGVALTAINESLKLQAGVGATYNSILINNNGVGIGTTNPTSALTVKGDTSLETLSVSGVSTFSDQVNITSTNSLVLGSQNQEGGGIIIWNENNHPTSYFHIYNVGNAVVLDNTGADAGSITIRSSSNVTLGGGDNSYSVECSGDSVRLFYADNKKFETLGAGVTVTGTTFTNQLSVSGVSTCVSDINVGVDTSSGVVLTSQNGTKYRLIVANDGTLSTTAV